MITDPFSIDIYCCYLNTPCAEEAAVEAEVEGVSNRSTLQSRSPFIRPVTPCARRTGYVLARLGWLAIGPALLMIISVLKLEARPVDVRPLDAGFAAVVAAILLIRWGAYLAGDRRDSSGGRTSIQGPVIFSLLTGIATGCLWGLVSLISSQQLLH